MWDTIKEAIYLVAAITAIIADTIAIVDSFKKK